MTTSTVITSEILNETYNKFKRAYEGRKEDYFAPLFLSAKFDKSIEKVLDYCAYGNHDYGIDAYYIDKDSKNLYLYQFKWSNSYDLFKITYQRLIQDGIVMIFGNPSVDSSTNKLILKLKRELEEYKDAINKVYICFVFNGDPEKAESSRALESLRESLESRKYLIDEYFNNNQITLTIQYISNEIKKTAQLSRVKETPRYNIAFEVQSKKIGREGELLYVGFIKLFDLYQMFVGMQQRLFDKNIRSGLAENLPPNQAIRKTLNDIIIHKKLSPEYFTFHHNGVTLFAEKFKIEENGIATIIEPRVLNGAQTISTLFRFIENLPKYSSSQHDYEMILKKIEVIGRIITNCSPDFVTQITISNNKQNPVESWHLRANDLIQCEFEDKFRQSGIFYERQENSFSNFLESELEELGIEHTKELKIKKLAQTLLAIQGEVDKVAEIGKIFEMDNWYNKAFQPEFLKSDARKIILAYKIQSRIGAIIKDIESRGESKYYFVRYAKNLVWAMVIQGLFNDHNLEDYLENYGNSLTIEANFNVIIKDIGSKKIRRILSSLIENKEYISYIENEKFAFLKTKGAFDNCMKIAGTLYGWKKVKI